MKKATATIKMTYTELETLIEMMGRLPDDNLPKYKSLLRQQFKDIKERLDEKIREAVNDQRIGEESSSGQTEVETSEGACIPCDD